jgi:hypothetical protein
VQIKIPLIDVKVKTLKCTNVEKEASAMQNTIAK